jgi:hypothetical protein
VTRRDGEAPVLADDSNSSGWRGQRRSTRRYVEQSTGENRGASA